MDSTNLMLGLLFGSIGAGMCLYGKKAQRAVPFAAGLALMVLPYCIPNAIALLVTCCVVTTVPWFMRNA